MRASIVLASLALVMVAFAAGNRGTGNGATMAQAEPANAMSVDAVSGGAIDASRSVTTADPFDVDIYIQHGGGPSLDYSWYEAILCFDPGVLDFVPAADLDRDGTAESWAYTDLGEMRAHVAVWERSGGCPGNPANTRLYGASSASVGQTSTSGVAATATFRCVGSGTTTLHLVSQAEDGGFFAQTGGTGGVSLPTTLADAVITCSPPPTATPCPPDVCTPTATPQPEPTPTPTPTPDPSAQPNLMSVDAVSGGAIDATRQLPVGSEFDVDVHIQHGGSSSFDYVGYDAVLCFDSQVLDFVPTQDMDGDTVLESGTYTDLGDMFLQGTMAGWGWEACATTPLDASLFGGAGRAAGTTDASGAAITDRFACVAEGVATLHLVSSDEVPDLYSTTLGTGGVSLPTDLADATITCLPDTDGDRCGDRKELVTGLDPIDPADFYSVPVPAQADADPNGPKDAAVTMEDVLAVLRYVGAHEGDAGDPNPNDVAYDTVKGSCPQPFSGDAQSEGLCYDRSPSVGANPPWDAGPPDGAVNMSDVLAALAQVGLDCTGTP
jgi:hypothetical protein